MHAQLISSLSALSLIIPKGKNYARIIGNMFW